MKRLLQNIAYRLPKKFSPRHTSWFVIFILFLFLAPLPDSFVFANPLDIVGGLKAFALLIPNLLAEGLFNLSGLILTASAWLLDTSITFSLDINSLSVGAVNVAWGAVRDLSNVVFVFILVYISIMTILQAGGFETKKILTSLVVVALLVNFSLFFTKLVIDASNIFAVAFYEQITAEGGLSASLANGLRLQTIVNEGVEGLGGTAGAFVLNPSRLFTVYIVGTIATLIAVFSFGTAAIMFIVRSVMLMFLMVLSPLAFVARILPGTEKYYNLWWSHLLKYSFYAPAYILLITLTVMIIGTGSLLPGVGEEDLSFSGAVAGWFAGDVGGVSFFAVLFQFAIVIALIYGSYILAKQFGLMGAETVMKTAKATTGALTFGAVGIGGRQLLGRGASILASSERFQKAAIKGRVAGTLLQGTRSLATASYDARSAKVAGKSITGMGKALGKGGYEKELDTKIEERVAFAKSIGGDKDEDYIKNVLSPRSPLGDIFRNRTVAATQLILKIKESEEKELEKEERELKNGIKSNYEKLSSYSSDLHSKEERGEKVTVAELEELGRLENLEEELDKKKEELDKKKEKIRGEIKTLRQEAKTIKSKPTEKKKDESDDDKKDDKDTE
ncbi:MAG: hypothetical protein WD003_02230 [Candidatus Paceibacterota bacterium]